MSDKQQETKKYHFKAEVKQLLDILVHSLYTSREIFLRELISNASDALDKLRFESNKGTELDDKDLPLEIKIDLDEKKKILTVSDTGIGMNQAELISNIGTIAKSGTAEFLKQLAESKNDVNNLIGKFGVGFYSVFMVAKEVVIKSKPFAKDSTTVEWRSDGLGDFEIKEINEKMSRGTKIEIHLKDDAEEFAQKFRLENVIKSHSNFISYPILLDGEKINTVAAIWREPKSSIKAEQYNEFYKFLTYDNQDPMDVIHKAVDAPIQFNALLFIPKKHFDLFYMDRENYGLDLYVRRVLIQHKNKDLLPEYLSFVKGVVDSEDLPLNISRETLQENLVFTKIASSVTSQVLSYLGDKAKKEPEKYIEFWKEHGKILKLGYSDYSNLEKYLDLLRFNSSHNTDKDGYVSLTEYVERFKEDQKEIYYIAGSSRQAIEQDPHLEIFKKKGLEVLFLYDPVDEFVVSSLRKYKEYEFKSADMVDLKNIEKLKNIEEKKSDVDELDKDDQLHFASLLSKFKEILGERVEDVKESQRLSDSPSCLVNPEDSLSASMQKILRMTNKEAGIQKRIFEVNKDHKLIRNLLTLFKVNPLDKFIIDSVEQMFESALLMDGDLEDPHNLVSRLNRMLADASDLYTAKDKK